MKFFAVLSVLSTAAVGAAASAIVGTVGPPADGVRGAAAGRIPKPIAPGAAEEAAGLFPFDPNDTVGLRAVASAAAPSSPRHRGLDLLKDATGRFPAPRESPPPPSGPAAAEVAAALFPLEGRSRRKLTTEPCPGDVGHVDCVDGNAVDELGNETGEDCATACGGYTNDDCCSGYQACMGFTGRVCRDGSCMGHKACMDSNVELITDSCRDGAESCKQIAWRNGKVFGKIIGSCYGVAACSVLMGGGTYTGNSIFNSCHGQWACRSLGSLGSLNGMISNSCFGYYACQGAIAYGTISGDISNSCNGTQACRHAAAYSGSHIGGIYDSCLGSGACQYIAEHGALDGMISNSCNGPSACQTVVRMDGAQLNGAISNSCLGDQACKKVSESGVLNGSISNSCLGEHACRHLAYPSYDDISHGLNDCCTAANSCTCGGYCREEQLPDDCKRTDTSPPTTVPTKTPTSTPTSSPTSHPTTAPTNSPTSSPIKAPWEIQHTSTESNFTSSNPNGTITMKFLIGKMRNHTESAFAGMCDPAQEGGTAIDAGVMTTHVEVEDSDFPNMDQLTVEHEFDMGLVAGSNAYDDNTDTIKFCQRVELVQYLDDGTNFVIAQQLTNVAITFNLTTGFTVDVNLDEAEVNEANGTANLDSFIFAIHCDGSEEMNELPVGTKIKPNDDLDICVKSSSPDVEIEEISSMTIQGKKPDETDSSLAVVADGSPSIPAITYFTHQTATGVAVRTRVPTNGFDFEAENAFISVVGSVALNLKGGRRRLADGAGSANRDLQAAGADEDVASFDLSVSLEPEESFVGDGFVVMASSAKDGPEHQGLAVLATLLASALAFVW